MKTHTNEIEELVWERLSLVPDPEIPVISITELGVVRGVYWDGQQLRIVITPTYTGCPAMQLFVAEIRAAMHEQGFDDLVVETVYSPAWTTDWISAEGRTKLLAYGIAPPGPTDPNVGAPVRFMPRRPGGFAAAAIACPQCGSSNTERLSAFGSTPCKALYRCLACREPFEHFKPI